uniref:Uncharacterized protein n=1 Tax=Avena sativa TaxID=4498 RepID=A0ACD5VNI1_AVESA
MAATLGKVMEEEAAADQQLRQQGSGSKVFSVSRRLTRDSSAGAAPSFRVYYGVASAGAVPFLWESQPGTPKKDASSDSAMPPLTPPPSYYAAAKENVRTSRKGSGGGGRKAGILGYILPRFSMARRRTRPSGSPTSSFSSVSSSSSSSAFSSFRGTQSPACSSMRGGGSRISSGTRAPSACSSMRGRGGYGSSRRMHASSSASSFSDEEETAVAACFGVRAESFRALKACRVAVTVRSALASVGGGHALQTQKV